MRNVFMSGKGTMNAVFVSKMLQEKYGEKREVHTHIAYLEVFDI